MKTRTKNSPEFTLFSTITTKEKTRQPKNGLSFKKKHKRRWKITVSNKRMYKSTVHALFHFQNITIICFNNRCDQFVGNFWRSWKRFQFHSFSKFEWIFSFLLYTLRVQQKWVKRTESKQKNDKIMIVWIRGILAARERENSKLKRFRKLKS